MHESPTPDQDLYSLLGVDRGRSAIQLHADLDSRLEVAKRDADKGSPSMSPEDWDATRIGRDILGYAARKAQYDDALEQGRRFTWVELEQLAGSPLRPFAPVVQQAKNDKSLRWLAVGLGVCVLILALIWGIVALAGGGDDDSGGTAAAVDNAVVYEVGDRGTVVQVTEGIDMTQVAPEAADIGLCGDRLCPSGHDPAVGPMADGSIAVTWGDGNGQDHRVAVSPDTGEIVDYVTASTSGRDERTAVLVGKPDRGWPGWDSNTLYRVGDDGETIKGDLVYYETDGTVWFISYQDRGTLYKGTVVKR